MFGKGEEKKEVDAGHLSLLVHAVSSDDAFGLVEKIWQENARYVRVDQGSGKELLRFVFSKPACIVWLQRDQGRTDAYELVLLWEEDVTEVYVLDKAQNGQKVGDDSRAQVLLNAILSLPSTVPAKGQN